MPKTKVEVYNKDQLIYPFIESDHVTFSNGMKVSEMLDQSISMPTVVHEDSSFKVGVGDQDMSSAIVDSSVAEMTIKGKTYQNILPEPSTHVLTNNKEMFKINEGLDSNVEIVDGVSKSAILSGQTLVNCIIDTSRTGYNALSSSISIDNDGWITAKAGSSNNHFELKMDNLNIKPSTRYLFVFECESNSFQGSTNNLMIGNTYGSVVDSPWNEQKAIPFLSVGVTKFIMTTKSDFSSLNNPIGCRSYISVGSGVTKFRYIIIEYQEGMENWDIPYFEGMQSVKMPVLTTIGKNLLNMSDYSLRFATTFVDSTDNSITFTTTESWGGLLYDFYLKPNQTYHVSFDSPQSTSEIRGFVRLLNTSSSTIGGSKSYSFTTDSTGSVRLTIETPDAIENATVSNIQIEEGDIKTSYEPYKTNILSTPEEVVLRSVENAQDTINLNTGEYVQRIGEVILNGSEPWEVLDNNTENTIGFSLRKVLPLRKTGDKYVKVNCDKLPSHKENLWNNDKIGCVTENNINQDLNDTQLQVRVLKSTLSTQDTNGFKSWLQTNPLTIQYILETPIIKTVDLSSSGNWEKTVLDGSENWVLHNNSGDYVEFRCGNMINNIHDSHLGFSDKFPVSTGGRYERIAIVNGSTYITVESTKAKTVEQLQSWLSQNPVTVWYQTSTTIDSTQVKQPIFFKDGHIQLSSGVENSLIPALDYQAKTSNSYVMDLMKTNTKYTMKAKSASGAFTIDGTSYGAGTNGTFTTPTSMTNKLLIMSNKTNEEVMILEGDVVSKTIPYFKGIKSAFEGEDKIEVLSTGKNLFDKNKVLYGKSTNGNGELIDSPSYVTSDLISVKPNTNYTVKHLVVVSMYDKNGSYISGLNANHEQRTFTTPSNCSYIRIRNWGLLDTVELQKEVLEKTVLQEGDSIETYEPYKSNSTKIPLLSPLRSLPNGVCDELIIDRMKNKATLIQRVGEQMYDGSNNENWCNGYGGATGNRNKFEISLPYISKAEPLYSYSNHFICERTSAVPDNDWAYRAYANGSILYFLFSPDVRTVELHNVDKWKRWLQANPLTVLYPLATPIITEVDLEGFPYIYKDGYIFLNSEIVPTTEIIYSINQSQQISASNEDIIRHEKELTYLQKLVAQYVQVDYESVLLSLKV